MSESDGDEFSYFSGDSYHSSMDGWSSEDDASDAGANESAWTHVPAKDVKLNGAEDTEHIRKGFFYEVIGAGRQLSLKMQSVGKNFRSLEETLVLLLTPLATSIVQRYSVDFFSGQKSKSPIPLTVNLVIGCLFVFILCGTYRCTPAAYYDDLQFGDKQNAYLRMQCTPPYEVFMAFLRTIDNIVRKPGPGEVFRRPESDHEFVTFLLSFPGDAFAEFVKYAATLPPDVCMSLGLDDYQIAGRSPLWRLLFGMPKHYNKQKASSHGTVLHTIATGFLRLPIHIATATADDSEKKLTITKKLIGGLRGFLTRSEIPSQRIIVDFDRGYGPLRAALSEMKVKFVATVQKRHKLNPGPVALGSAKPSIKAGAALVMNEEGPPIARHLRRDNTVITAFRNKTRVVILETNHADFACSWTLDVEDAELPSLAVNHLPEEVQEAFEAENQEVLDKSALLCVVQRTPVWRWDRKLSGTSTQVIELVRLDAQVQQWDALNGFDNNIFGGVVELYVDNRKAGSGDDVAAFTEEYKPKVKPGGGYAVKKSMFDKVRAHMDFLQELLHIKTEVKAALRHVVGVKIDTATKPQLIAALKELGKKKDLPDDLPGLVKLVKELRAVPPQSVQSMMLALGEKAFEGTRSTRAGVHLEDTVRDLIAKGGLERLVDEAEVKPNPFVLLAVYKDAGLRESQYSPYVSTSADGILHYADEEGDVESAVLEIKVATTDKSRLVVEKATETYGTFSQVDVGYDMTKDDKVHALTACQETPSYLVQVLHHAAVLGLPSTVLVHGRDDGKDGGLMRATQFVFDEDMLRTHVACFHVLGQLYLPWLQPSGANAPVPSSPFTKADNEHLIALRGALRDYCYESPVMGKVRALKPTCVQIHNLLKPTSDKMRQEARKLRADTNGFGPAVALMAETLAITALAGVRLWRASEVGQRFKFDVEALGELSVDQVRARLNDLGSTVNLLHGACRSLTLDLGLAKEQASSSSDKAARKHARHAEAASNPFFRPDSEQWVATALEHRNKANKASGTAFVKAWIEDDVLVAFRTHPFRGNEHRAVNVHALPEDAHVGRMRCVLDCVHCENVAIGKVKEHENLGKSGTAGREGAKTVWYCKDCEVHLSIESRKCFGNRSAWNVWHTDPKLPAHPYTAAAAASAVSPVQAPTESARKRRRHSVSVEMLKRESSALIFDLDKPLKSGEKA